MIEMSVLYPNEPGSRFDIDYYCDRHVPMVRKLLGAACSGISVQRGLSGLEPNSRPPFAATAHLYFESMETFAAAWAPHAVAIRADIPNYTNVRPTVQFSEVKIPLGSAAA